MNLRTRDAQGAERAVDWFDDPATPPALVDEESSDVNRYLALRMNMRGERAMTTAGVSWI